MSSSARKATPRSVPKDVEEIKAWFDQGKSRGHVHMLIKLTGKERWPIYLNLGDGQERLDAVIAETQQDGGDIVEVYCLNEARDEQLALKKAWQLAWDFKRRSNNRLSSAPAAPTPVSRSDFKGLRYYGVRFDGYLWVRGREMTYCFSISPQKDFFTEDPSRAKVWCHTRLLELKKVINQGQKGFDWTRYEVVNMHTGAAAPLQRILMQDKLTL